MSIWLVMLLGGLLTFGIRFSFIYLFGRFEVPETLRKALHYVPPAVHHVARKIKIGKPILYNPYNDAVKERNRIKSVLESTIHDLYISIVLESYSGIPLPH